MKRSDKLSLNNLIFPALLIIILGFVVYGNSLQGKFIWDDEHLVNNNVYIRDWSNILKIFSEDIGKGAGIKYYFYRPFQMLTYMIDYSLWRLNVKGYHLTNILLHITVTLVLYWLINILYNNKLLSFFTGILFIIHPIHTEAVSYISGRADPLSALFILLCFIFYIKGLRSENISTYFLMLLCYISALLSRENSLILPMLFLLYHYSFRIKLNIKRFLPILFISLIYISLRMTILKSLLPHTLCYTTLLQRIPGFFIAITNYSRLLLLPFNLHMEYGNKLFKLADPQAILGVIIMSSVIMYGLNKRKSNNLIFFSVFWFFITLLPTSNIYPINAYMAEHWLYLPSIGVFLIVANILSHMYRRKTFQIFAIASIVSLLTFYSFLTIRQNDYWKEPIAFYERTLKYAPDSSRVYYNLGKVYSNIGKKKRAITSYQKAIQIKPNYLDAYNNLGALYSSIGKKERAIALYKEAMGIDPNDTKAYNNLGLIYSERDERESAIKLYQKAIEIDRYNADAYYNIGNEYAAIGENKKAIDSYSKAIEIKPENASVYVNLANVYSNIGKIEEAIILYKKAIEIDPTYVGAYSNLGNRYAAVGRYEEAIKVYQKAIEIDPSLANIYYNLSVIYLHKKQYRLAIEYCDKAARFGYEVNAELLRILEPHRKKESQAR